MDVSISLKMLTLSVQVFINIFIYSILYDILPYKENDSPQPQVPVIFGLLKTNSEDNFDSMKSISVPGKEANSDYKARRTASVSLPKIES